jgi:hypothetical protein
MGEITTIGIDIAKRVFQLHGVDATGGVVLCRRLRRSLLRCSSALSCGDGSMRDRALLGARGRRVRA